MKRCVRLVQQNNVYFFVSPIGTLAGCTLWPGVFTCSTSANSGGALTGRFDELYIFDKLKLKCRGYPVVCQSLNRLDKLDDVHMWRNDIYKK